MDRERVESNTMRLLFGIYEDGPNIELPNHAIPPHVLAFTEDVGVDASRAPPDPYGGIYDWKKDEEREMEREMEKTRDL